MTRRSAILALAICAGLPGTASAQFWTVEPMPLPPCCFTPSPPPAWWMLQPQPLPPVIVQQQQRVIVLPMQPANPYPPPARTVLPPAPAFGLGARGW